jgi:hypothetical protein
MRSSPPAGEGRNRLPFLSASQKAVIAWSSRAMMVKHALNLNLVAKIVSSSILRIVENIGRRFVGARTQISIPS